MEVRIAKTAGFCFGVKRAVDKVYEQVETRDKPIYTFGPIIHNEEVVDDLTNRGVKVIHSVEELNGLQDGVIVIRSHGISREIYDRIESTGIEIVDATCPFVKKIHTIVQQQSEEGKQIIVVGNPDHPEVQGIIGWSETPVFVVETVEEAEKINLPDRKTICIVSQTTFNYKKFQDIVAKIEKKGYDINVVNTICNATHERQVEASQIASDVDGMIVIGGKNSSNTQKLFEICRRECGNTVFIQTLADLDDGWLRDVQKIGITAGASTPNKSIEEVQNYVREF